MLRQKGVKCISMLQDTNWPATREKGTFGHLRKLSCRISLHRFCARVGLPKTEKYIKTESVVVKYCYLLT